MDHKKYVSYLRCSTEKQGISSLGLNYQKKEIEAYVSHVGGLLIKSFSEIASGSDKKEIRPILKKAISFCQKNGYILIASHFDRLSRSHTSFNLIKESGINFITLDNLSGNSDIIEKKLKFGVEELKIISERTKNALLIKSELLKKEGKTLGNPILNDVRYLAHKARKESILLDTKRNQLTYKVNEIYQETKSFKKCSDKLNQLNVNQPNGKPFTQQQVRRYIQRYQKLYDLQKTWYD